MVTFFMLFIAVSVLLIPFAWVAGIYDKFKGNNMSYGPVDKMVNFMFIPFGPIILALDVVADLAYFWKNNFRSNLK